MNATTDNTKIEARAAKAAAKAARKAEMAAKREAAKVARAAKREAAKAVKAARAGQLIKTPKRTGDYKLIKRVGEKDHKADLTRYKHVFSASGSSSLDCGDDLAKQLRGATLDEVYKQAAKLLREPEAALRKRYDHLNVGMQRMNLGNRMRAAQVDGEE